MCGVTSVKKHFQSKGRCVGLTSHYVDIDVVVSHVGIDAAKRCTNARLRDRAQTSERRGRIVLVLVPASG